MSSSFDLRRLRYFLKVAELGSLSAAARALHIAQPALSQQIRTLEQELSVDLFARSPRGVVLTEAGNRLVTEAKTISLGIKRAVERVRAGTEPQGQVVLGVGQLSGSVLAVPLLMAVAERLPQVHLQVRELLGGLMPDLIRAGTVDFAISLDAIDDSNVRSVPLLRERLCLVGQRRQVEACLRHSSADRFSFMDLDGLPLYMARRGQFIRDTVEQIAKSKGVAINLRGEVDSHHLLREIALKGVGCCILPSTAVLSERRQRDLYVGRIASPIIHRDTYLVHRKGVSPAAAAVICLVLEVVEGLVRAGAWEASMRTSPRDIRKNL